MTAATRIPQHTASATPTTASPRIWMRTRHRRREARTPVTTQAASIDGAVSRPSNEWVRARTGSRMIEGKIPK